MALMSKNKNINSKTTHFKTKDKNLYQELPNGAKISKI